MVSVEAKSRSTEPDEVLFVGDDGSFIGWCKTLRELNEFECDGSCDNCFCG